jgi:cholest-4-en-3-one 26-monooxygenase
MTVDSLTRARPDVDLADGSFYAGDSRAAYAWMRANEPVFRDRNGLAGAATYRAVIDAERNPELFSSAGGIRPDHVPAVPQMIDLDDPVHLRRRKSAMTRRLLERLPDLRMASEAALPLRPANFVSGLGAGLKMRL